jgi:hypothetical protein
MIVGVAGGGLGGGAVGGAVQMVSNGLNDRDLNEGVGKSFAQGFVVGAVTGGIAAGRDVMTAKEPSIKDFNIKGATRKVVREGPYGVKVYKLTDKNGRVVFAKDFSAAPPEIKDRLISNFKKAN